MQRSASDMVSLWGSPKREAEMPMSSHLLRWSTEMLPERARFSTFREEFARQNLALDVSDRGGGRPRINVTYLPLGEVGVCSLVTTPAEFIRHKHHLKNN